MAVPCRRDLACYRNDGHPGDCAYPTPETTPIPMEAQRVAPSASADAAWLSFVDDIFEAVDADSAVMLADAVARHRPAIEAAIRAERPALDVERLARALAIAEVGCVGFAGFHDGNTPEKHHERDASRIAAEYARLAAQPASEPPDER